MAKISKTVVDADLRARVFADAIFDENDEVQWVKLNDRQYGCILTDMNGEERLVRLGAIVAEEREDKTARDLMKEEMDEYTAKQKAKAVKAAERAKKAEADKARREAKAKEKEA